MKLKITLIGARPSNTINFIEVECTSWEVIEQLLVVHKPDGVHVHIPLMHVFSWVAVF